MKKKQINYPLYSNEEYELILTGLYSYSLLSNENSSELKKLIKRIKKKVPKNLDEDCLMRSESILDEYTLSQNQADELIEIDPDLKLLLQDAYEKQLTVEIEYLSDDGQGGYRPRKNMQVDIYSIEGNEIRGHCHFNQDERTFYIDKIIEIKKTKKKFRK